MFFLAVFLNFLLLCKSIPSPINHVICQDGVSIEVKPILIEALGLSLDENVHRIPVKGNVFQEIIRFFESGLLNVHESALFIDYLHAAKSLRLSQLKVACYQKLVEFLLSEATMTEKVNQFRQVRENQFLDEFISFLNLEELETIYTMHISIGEIIDTSDMAVEYFNAMKQCGPNLERIWHRSSPDSILHSPSKHCLESLNDIKAKWFQQNEFAHIYIVGIRNLSDLSQMDMIYSLSLVRDDCKSKDLVPISTLRSLKRLSAHTNLITDIQPLAALKHLEFLDLGRNRISDISPLASLSSLKFLFLSANPIKNMEILGRLKNIEMLDIGLCNLSSMKFIENMPRLTELYVNNNKISDLSPLKSTPRLQVFSAVGNRISDIRPLRSLHYVTILILEGNAVSNLSPLKDLKYLKELNMDHNQIQNVERLANLSNLSLLGLSNNQIVDLNPLNRLYHLKYLNVHGNPVLAFGMLRELKELQYFIPFWGPTIENIDVFWLKLDQYPVNVIRNDVFTSSLIHLMAKSPAEFHNHRVYFHFLGEQGEDYGGLSREFIQLYAQQVFGSELRLFTRQNDGLYYFFPRGRLSDLEKVYYECIGRVLGFAINEAIPLGVSLKDAFFILMQDVNHVFNMFEFETFDPEMAKRYQMLLSLSGEELESLEFYFVTDEGTPLSPEYPVEELVTLDNVSEYVSLKINWIIKSQHQEGISRLIQGFYTTFGGQNIGSWQELKSRLTGEIKINVQDWLNHIHWDGISNSEQDRLLQHQFQQVLIKWNAMNEQERLKKLLMFTTGLRALPANGFSGLNPSFTIKRIPLANGVNLIPTARTCFNQLEIGSVYSSIDWLERQLVYALEHLMTFSFQ